MFTNNVPSVTQTLKSLDPDYTRFGDSLQEYADPPSSCWVKQTQRQAEQTRRKDDAKFNEPDGVLGGLDNFVFGCLFVELLDFVVFEFDVLEVPVVQEVVNGGTGYRNERVFEFIEVPEYFSPVGCENR